jgi:hypothetical protein
VPDAPTGLSLTPGDGEIDATWTAPADDGGSAITTYSVQWRSPSGSGSYTTFVHSASTTPAITITGIPNDVLAGVRVAAVNVLGTGAYTSEATATPTASASVVVSASMTGSDGTDATALTLETGGPFLTYDDTSDIDYTEPWHVKSNRIFCTGDYSLLTDRRRPGDG